MEQKRLYHPEFLFFRSLFSSLYKEIKGTKRDFYSATVSGGVPKEEKTAVASAK